MRSVRERIARWLFPFGSVRPILCGVCRGMRYEVGPGIGATFCFGGDGFHHRYYAGVIQPGMKVWDVGANTGQSLLAFGRLVGRGGSVSSFEPVQELAELAQRQARLNDLEHVQVHCVAAGSEDGFFEFEFNPTAPTQGKLSQVEREYKICGASLRKVRVVALDSFALAEDLPKPDFLKIDVEGAGAAVLQGARCLLEEVGPTIFMELHGPEERHAINELGNFGYTFSGLAGNRITNPIETWCSPILCQRA